PPSGSRAPPRATTDQEPARASASPPPRPPYADDGGRLRRREAGPFIPLAAPVPGRGLSQQPLLGQTPAGSVPALRHPFQHRQCAGLVERLVEVAALRALHAGRAAEQARAAAQHPRGVLDPALERLEPALGDADAAGVPV